MKTARLFLLIPLFVLLGQALSAQVQWFQNQDGNNQAPNGTSGTCVKKLNSNSFVACYLWRVEYDTNTWKISRTSFDGNELKTFYLSGITSLAEMRVGKNSTVYVLQKNYPIGLDPVYKIYKLNENLQIQAVKTLSFPNGYTVYNMNCFELDNDNNLYLAGDGQYTVNNGLEPFAFVMKMNKNLGDQWCKKENSLTSYTSLHIDNNDKVTVIADHYSFFPDIYIKKFNSNGSLVQSKTLTTDPGRYSLFSSLDGEDNLLLYGGKTIGDTAQGMFLYRISRNTGSVMYEKTHFVSQGTQLNDLKVDNQGKIFTLVTLYNGPEQISRISRINPNNGNISWNHSVSYTQDSCLMMKLAMDNNERFYAIGQRNSNTFFAKGYALRMRKSGQCEGSLAGPDSVCFQRVHWLNEGIIDNNERLISIGGTYGFDTMTYEMIDVRAFAVRFGNNTSNKRGSEPIFTAETNENGIETGTAAKLLIYPNPSYDKLNVSNLQEPGYDKLTVYNMQGAVILTRSVNENTVNLDVSSLANGAYLLVLHSSATLKEKSLKFLVRK